MVVHRCALVALVAASAAAVPPLRINVGTVGGQLPESALLAAVAQAKTSLLAEPSRSVLIQLPPGEFSINTSATPFELSDVSPAASASLTIAGSGGNALGGTLQT